MRALLVVAMIALAGICRAQVTAGGNPVDTIVTYDTDTFPFHYPYFGERIPPFMGAVIGYEGITNHCIEAGLIFHTVEMTTHGRKLGPIVGFALTYKKSVVNSLQTLEAEAGVYAPFSIGVGFSGNFYEGTRAFGFRPFVGTSWWHLQVLAGYSFYGKNQSYISELDRFTLKVRYAIPITRIFKAGITNPGNNY